MQLRWAVLLPLSLLLLLPGEDTPSGWVGPLPAGADPAAQSKGGARTSRRRRARRPPGQQQPATVRIQEIQRVLIREGWLAGEASGVWDDPTRSAFRRFQESHGHPATGKPDALSLIRLGLGPETAGAGAPRPRATARQDAAAAEEASGSGQPE